MLIGTYFNVSNALYNSVGVPATTFPSRHFRGSGAFVFTVIRRSFVIPLLQHEVLGLGRTIVDSSGWPGRCPCMLVEERFSLLCHALCQNA